MNKASIRVVSIGVAGLTALSVAGVTVLGINPAGKPDVVPPTVQALVSGAARPVRVSIPQLGVDKSVSDLGVKGRTMDLPPAAGVGWWTGSAVPGRPGVAVMTGFIRTQGGAPGALIRLQDLKPNDRISVTLANGTKATYAVSSIKAYPAGSLPPSEVFSRAAQPVLKLVTTGGALKPGDPNENVVVTSVAGLP